MTRLSAPLDNTGETQALHARLVTLANRQGASAAIIDAASIVVKDNLAGMCRRPGCPNYGLAASCPPHVGGPDQFRQWQKNYRQALLIKLDVPTEVLLGNDRDGVFRQLHFISAAIEKSAMEAGCKRARAFAGGSCKGLFCADMAVCPVIAGNGACLHPEHARPSMSGFGIDVFGLMKAVGWKADKYDPAGQAEGASSLPIVGLVLLD